MLTKGKVPSSKYSSTPSLLLWKSISAIDAATVPEIIQNLKKQFNLRLPDTFKTTRKDQEYTPTEIGLLQ